MDNIGIQPFPTREAFAKQLGFVNSAGEGDAHALNLALVHELRPLQEAMLKVSRQIVNDSRELAVKDFDHKNLQMRAIADLADFISSGMNIVNSIMDLLIRQDISYNQPVIPALVVEDAVIANNFLTKEADNLGVQSRVIPLKLDASRIILDPDTYSEKKFQANPALLSMAIGTLIRNALRAVVHENSKVDSEALSKKIKVSSTVIGDRDSAGQILKISIHDEAKLIPADVQAKMWQRGFSASKSTGVGLDAAKNFIQTLGGTIEYVEVPEKAFVIKIPITPVIERTEYAKTPQNILIVNDDGTQRCNQEDAFNELSEPYGFTVQCFSDSDELVDHLTREPSLLNPETLIILDYRGVDHAAVVNYLREINPRPKILLGSSCPEDIHVDELRTKDDATGVLNLDNLVDFTGGTDRVAERVLQIYSNLNFTE